MRASWTSKMVDKLITEEGSGLYRQPAVQEGMLNHLSIHLSFQECGLAWLRRFNHYRAEKRADSYQKRNRNRCLPKIPAHRHAASSRLALPTHYPIADQCGDFQTVVSLMTKTIQGYAFTCNNEPHVSKCMYPKHTPKIIFGSRLFHGFAISH